MPVVAAMSLQPTSAKRTSLQLASSASAGVAASAPRVHAAARKVSFNFMGGSVVSCVVVGSEALHFHRLRRGALAETDAELSLRGKWAGGCCKPLQTCRFRP